MQDSFQYRILVIDDNASIVYILKQYLSIGGYLVDTAMDGNEGIRKIKTKEYDLIITDIRMPGHTGDEILRYVKDIKGMPTPVVGISGTPHLYRNLPFDAFLSKPFTMKELLNVTVDLIVPRGMCYSEKHPGRHGHGLDTPGIHG